MIYLSQLLGNPVLDADGKRVGTVSDLGIATGEVFPRVTSLAIMGPNKTPFMISWRKYLESYDDEEVRLRVPSTDIRFSYLQPEEVLIARDLLNKQVVDTRGMRVVRVNDLKLSDTSSSQLRLLGAEVGARGVLRSISPGFERVVCKLARSLGKPIPERIIAWNYMDLIERDLSSVKLSVSHKTLDDMHPADIADIIERLDPDLRGRVFATLDDEMAAEAMAELDDEEMAADLVGGMEEGAASRMLSEMDPDDAAELVSELDYEKAEKLLLLMGVKEQNAIRQLLGYREDTAGRIMTQEFVAVLDDGTVEDAVMALCALEEGFESVRYVYLVDDERRLTGVVTLPDLIVSGSDALLKELTAEKLVTASPDDDQEDVAKAIAKYNLLAMPVVDDDERLIGIVTVDDALEVLEEEHEEDLALVDGVALGQGDTGERAFARLLSHEFWFFLWMLGMAALGVWSAQSGGGALGWTVESGGATLGMPAQSGGVALGALGGILLSFGLPLALRSADSMVRTVTNYFVDYDADDDDAPSFAGFSLRSLAAGIVFGALCVLATLGMTHALLALVGSGGVGAATDVAGGFGAMTGVVEVAVQLLRRASYVAAGVIVATYASVPAYLALLRRRDARGREPQGSTMRVASMLVALALYLAATMLLFA